MPTPKLTLDWQATPERLPLFQRIAETIARDIRRGRLRPGDRLPASRRLAKELIVHRNTVLSAYAELERQGYLTTAPARGTFVASDLPDRITRPARSVEPRPPVCFRLPEAPAGMASDSIEPGCLALVAGHPDLRELPLAAFARAHRAALKSSRQVLDYQSSYGQPRLLRALADFLRDSRGVVADSGELIVTRGSQQALHLAARALVRPNSAIAVEQYGYPPAWQAFRLAGARLLPVPVDRHGLDVARLERLSSEHDVVAVYVTPHHQYPTTVSMSAARRIQLLRLAEARRIAVIEDDYDHEYHFHGRPLLPLASADPARVVLHIGSLSKVFAPGLRLGYAVGQPSIISSMATHRRYIDRQGDHVTELALANLIEDGELAAHIRRMHRKYQERREVLHENLRARLGGALSFRVPDGGLGLWARLTCGVSAEAWTEAALARRLIVHPASRFRFDGARAPYLRLGYSPHDAKELKHAVTRLERALADLGQGPHQPQSARRQRNPRRKA